MTTSPDDRQAPPVDADGLPSQGSSGRGLAITSWLLVATLLVQAGLAGPASFLQPSLFELHGWLGMLTLLLAALVAMMAFFGRRPGWMALVAMALVLGSFGQIGLGYAGRRGGLAIASAVHVPLGVILTVAAAVLAFAITSARHSSGK